jgi:hypothetical protein
MSFSEDLDTQRAQVMRAVRQAAEGWASAMQAHKMAPPDADFADRLDRLSKAAAAEAVAWEHANAAGMRWRPVPGAEGSAPPYELRPGTGRRGPPALWQRFDDAVTTLNRAIAGTDAARVADAFAEMADATSAIAEAVARGDQAAAARGAA